MPQENIYQKKMNNNFNDIPGINNSKKEIFVINIDKNYVFYKHDKNYVFYKHDFYRSKKSK